MGNLKINQKTYSLLLLLALFICSVFISSGCSAKDHGAGTISGNAANSAAENAADTVGENTSDSAGNAAENTGNAMQTPQKAAATAKPLQEDTPAQTSPPSAVDMDWSAYFDGINGAAVIYYPSSNRYEIYNPELADTRRSPCSTFKIISSLAALENRVIDPDHSVRPWSGETFWNEDWNKDIDFHQAFRTSCVWYFRQVVDETGADTMQAELNKLRYGNCDISDWEGKLNTNNRNRALTGFWIESSLKISPKEQTEVMKRIFSGDMGYKEETLKQLKQVMLVTEENTAGPSIYGKTGMGKIDGIVVDCWFTGFAETADGNLYFCVYLGRTDGKNVSSAKAREIAVSIVSDAISD